MTPRAQEIIQDADRKIKKKDLVKLSRMEPEQQEQAAAQLAAGEIRSADEFPRQNRQNHPNRRNRHMSRNGPQSRLQNRRHRPRFPIRWATNTMTPWRNP